jgi:hypothetical protein
MLPNSTEQSVPFKWQRLLTYGNECYDKKNWMQAEYYYKQAESHLDYLWSADPTNVNLLMAWISSLHNLATLFEQQGNNAIGLQHLLIPHHRLLNLSQNNEAPESVKAIAINALKLTFTPILMYTKRHPICEDCQKIIKDFQHSLEMNEAVVH